MKYFSIIIPIYNVEKYLKRCIDSILKQSFSNYELILVNDGSTDNCKEICEEYAKNYKNIKLINKDNGGASSSRNLGIKNATGEWCVFVDSDDYIEDNNFLNDLKNLTKNNDVILYGFKEINEVNNKIIRERYNNLELINSMNCLKEKLIYLNEKESFPVSAWTHACKTDFLRKNNLYFIENLKEGEDIEWAIRMLLYEPKLVALNRCPYIYCFRDNSLSRNKETGFWKYRYLAIRKILKNLNNTNIDNSLKNEIYNYLAYQYILLIYRISKESSNKEKNDAWKEIKKIKFLKKYGKGRKVELCKFIINVFGVKIGSKILNIYKEKQNKIRYS